MLKIVCTVSYRTSCSGYCVIDSNRNVIMNGTIPLDSKRSLIQNSNQCIDALQSILNELNAMDMDCERKSYIVGVEKPMQSFGGAGWNTKGLTKLSQFNGIISYMCTKIFHCSDVIFVHPSKARSLLLTPNIRKEGGGAKHMVSKS